MGIRVLEPLVNPEIFEALPGSQRAVFRRVGVLLTAAVLGGREDGLQKVVGTFTDFLEATSPLTEQ